MAEATFPPPVDLPGPTPIFRLSCEKIVEAQNAALAKRCSKKVNQLSCRCSGCETDNRDPVIGAPSDAPLLNTAYDGHGGFLSAGLDAHWEVALGSSGTIPTTGWAAATVSPTSAWATSPYANANWVSNAAKAGADAYFRYIFNISSAVDPATFVQKMRFYADNRVWEIYINGVPQSTQPNGSSVLPQFQGVADTVETRGFDEGQEVVITLDNSWRRCENELVVHVKSPGGIMGFLAQNDVESKPDENGCDCDCHCKPAAFPPIQPCISVSWGDSKCDCFETDDVEIVCITVCNCYSNVTFEDLSIGQIAVTDAHGKPVPNLPNGSPSVEVVPSGPICFGDIGPCVDGRPSCVSREVVVWTRGAVGGAYRLSIRGICFKVCHDYQSERCFTLELCQD